MNKDTPYPRPTGHCHPHFIPNGIIPLEDDMNLNEEELAQALKYLRSIRADLVKGDLIIFSEIHNYRNVGVAIFDGSNIIDLDYDFDDYGHLPQNFRVIEDGVPINYWHDYDRKLISIDHNYIVWFDHRKVLSQCLSNIKFGLVNDKTSIIHTTFTYNNRDYKIIYDQEDGTVDDFYHLLSDSSDLLPFESQGEYVQDVPNALYIKPE